MISLDEAKAYLNVVGTDEDELISSYIDAADAFIRNYTNCYFTSQNITEERQITGWKFVNLNRGPLIWINSVKYFDWNDWQDVEGVMVFNWMLYNPNGFTAGLYKINYQVGYVSIPEDIKQTCKMLVSYYYNNNVGISKESISWISTEYNQEIPKWIYEILDKYRQLWISI